MEFRRGSTTVKVEDLKNKASENPRSSLSSKGVSGLQFNRGDLY